MTPPPRTERPALSRGTVDRTAERRTDAGWLARSWADPASRLLVVHDGRVLVEGGDPPALLLLPTAEAPDGERLFLGTEDGTGYWAVTGSLTDRPGSRAATLRDIGAELGDRDAGLLSHAVGLANWHATHGHCPLCGAPTVSDEGGHLRRCVSDGSSHWPRTDPAVIMLVHDGADRLVLGRAPTWPPRRFSVLAGFVEAGESAEQAVRREVAEEVGLDLTDLAYVDSQPWPFPRSLMLAYTARAEPVREVRPAVAELEKAGWWTRAQLRADLDAGRVLLPPAVSIARRLIDAWLAAPDDGAAAGG